MDVEDPDRVLGVEVWADRAALDEHMGHRHTQDFLAEVAGLITGEPVMAFHEVPDEEHAPAKPGAMHPADVEPPGTDRAPGARGEAVVPTP